ncbi:uncharacterized protein LOC135383434 [Ornithodoros turicata]|uniref:uncharacterized protein LOC135383434 n=1 Tax=Ornithodoros turicata TaxID=34597 RepID=UPI00313938FC
MQPLALVFMLFLGLCYAEDINYVKVNVTPCPDNNLTYAYLGIENCSSEPCEFFLGSKIRVKFMSVNYARFTVSVGIHAYFNTTNKNVTTRWRIRTDCKTPGTNHICWANPHVTVNGTVDFNIDHDKYFMGKGPMRLDNFNLGCGIIRVWIRDPCSKRHKKGNCTIIREGQKLK